LNGDYSNFVTCFREESDSLSQWRGYADYGKGCCIGPSHELLQQFCSNSSGLLRLEKVEYITDEQIVIWLRNIQMKFNSNGIKDSSSMDS
jgi:hypothetical protein